MTRTSIGGYKVTKRLEGDGEAYLVRSDRGTRAQLRLVPHPGSEAWAQARKEAAICARLDHPAIGKLVDSFEDGDRLALVDEPIDGVSLEQLLDKLEQDGSKLDPLAVWHVGYQIAGALSQAHSASDEHGDLVAISHGHLSPRHVAVSFNGFVRIDGLGLSPLIGRGAIKLDLRYAAPEQRSETKITPRGDIYSVAALLWALLAGSPPPPEPTVDELGIDFSEAFRDALARALESSLGKRRITSMELEQFLGDQNEPHGKGELANAVAALRRGGSLPDGLGGARRSASSGAGRPGGRKRASAPSMRRMPDPRGRQGTLLGVPAPRKKLESRPPAMDWEAASQAAKKPSVPPGMPDDLSWGDEQDETPPRAFGGLGALGGARPPRPGTTPASPAPPAADDDDDPNEGDRLSQEEIAEAIERADRAVDALSGEVPQPVASSDADVELLDDDDDDIDLIAAAVVHPDAPSGAELPDELAPVDEPPVAAEPAEDDAADDASGEATEAAVRDAITVPDPAALGAAAAQAAPARVAPAPVSPAPVSPAPAPSASEPESPATPTPWSDQPPPSEAQPLSWGTAALIAIVSAAATMAIGIGWVRSQSHPVLPAEPTLPSASVAAAPKPAPKPTAVATAKPTASAAAAPAKDGKDLPATKGYLVVTFAKDADAHVFSRVSDQGKVNEPLAVDCTQAHFLRIGKGDPPTWLTDGRAGVTVKCQAVTEITMRPPLR